MGARKSNRASRCQSCGKELSDRQAEAGVSVCSGECARKLYSDAPKIQSTGIFKTTLPRHRGHLLADYLARLDEPRFLEAASHFKNLAAAVIKAQGFPLNPQVSDRLKAPAPVFEAYQLRDAYQEIVERMQVLASRRVVEAIAVALREKYGDLGLRVLNGELENIPQHEPELTDLASDEIWRVISAAVEVGLLGQRLVVRAGKHEEHATWGKRQRKRLAKNSRIRTATAKKKSAIAWREMKRLKDANPDRSWTSIAKQLETELPTKYRVLGDPGDLETFGTLHWTRILAHTSRQRRAHKARAKNS